MIYIYKRNNHSGIELHVEAKTREDADMKKGIAFPRVSFTYICTAQERKEKMPS